MASAHQVVAAYWAAAKNRDWLTFAELVSEQVVYEAPQDRRLLIGVAPGPPRRRKGKEGVGGRASPIRPVQHRRVSR